MATTLYPGIPFSPQATLTNNIGAADSIIEVSDVSAFPPAPNLATIGVDEDGETILYAAKTEDALSGCQRGIEGAAKAWKAGEIIGRNFTAKDHADLIAAVTETRDAATDAVGAALTAGAVAKDAQGAAKAAQEAATAAEDEATTAAETAEKAAQDAEQAKKDAQAAADAAATAQGAAETADAAATRAAQAAAAQETLPAKQDTLVGLPGQVVEFDGMGLARAARRWSSRNLIINWDFRNPVNRNGKAEYTVTGCCIDRWRMLRANMTVKIESDGILLDNTSGTYAAYFGQPFENVSDLNGETLTLSFLTNDNLYTRTSVLNTTITDWQLLSGLSNEYRVFIAPTGASTGQTNPIVCWQIYPGASVKLKGVKLELGDHQTLASQNEDGEWEIIDPPDYDLQYALCSLYSPTTGEWIGYQHSNPNLLDNWYFSDPVNQRVREEYAVSSDSVAYTIDRWEMSRGTVTVGDGYVNFSSVKTAVYKRFMQKSELLMKAGQTYTLSLLAKVNSMSGSSVLRPLNAVYGTVPGAAGSAIEATNNFELLTYTFTPASDVANGGVEILCQNNTNSYIDIDMIAWKLELGPVQTLAHQDADGNWVLNDPPPNRALELAKCQRYFIDFAGYPSTSPGEIVGVGYFRNANLARIMIPLPVTMRATPTAIGENLFITSNAVEAIRINSIKVVWVNVGNSVTIDAATSEAGTAGATALLRLAGYSGSVFQLSADL